MNDWQPAETAPRDGSYFIVWASHGQYELAHYYELFHTVYDHVEGDLYRQRTEKYADGFNVNHFEWWMPLPAAPAPTV